MSNGSSNDWPKLCSKHLPFKGVQGWTPCGCGGHSYWYCEVKAHGHVGEDAFLRDPPFTSGCRLPYSDKPG